MAETRDPIGNQVRHTGAQSKLKISPQGEDEYYEVPITNVDWDRDVEVADIQHNTSLNPVLATTGLRYTGSFEYEGQNLEVMDLLMQRGEDGDLQPNRPIRVTITVKEYNHDDPDEVVRTIRFHRCIVENNSRDLPSDDVSSTTFDFQAEDMEIDHE